MFANGNTSNFSLLTFVLLTVCLSFYLSDLGLDQFVVKRYDGKVSYRLCESVCMWVSGWKWSGYQAIVQISRLLLENVCYKSRFL